MIKEKVEKASNDPGTVQISRSTMSYWSKWKRFGDLELERLERPVQQCCQSNLTAMRPKQARKAAQIKADQELTML